MNKTYHLDAVVYACCADCYMFLANGDLPEDPTYLDRVAEYLVEPENAVSWHAGDDLSEFSWRPCEYCGSRLGGSRHEAVCLVKIFNT